MTKEVLKLNIITIIYDSISELTKTIKSIDSQRIKPNKHIIVSKKLKYSQLKKFKNKYRHFILGKDKSLYNAMNVGKKNSVNRAVLFLNGGDFFINNEAISDILKFKKELYKNKILIFKTVLMNNNDFFYPKKSYFEKKTYFPHSSFIFFNSKSKANIDFNEKMIISSDGKWMREIVRESVSIKKINKNLVCQVLDGQSSIPKLKTVYYRFNENFFSGVKEIIKYILLNILRRNLYFRLIYLNKYDFKNNLS